MADTNRTSDDAITEAVKRILGEEQAKAKQAEAEKNDPWVRLEGTIRKVVGEELGKILGNEEQSTPNKEDGGFMEWITGGKRESNS